VVKEHETKTVQNPPRSLTVSRKNCWFGIVLFISVCVLEYFGHDLCFKWVW